MKFTETTRQKVIERSNGRCEVCGAPVETPQLHHRKPRGMGGTKDPASRSTANALAVHYACHEWIERNRTEATILGYLVPQHEKSTDTPVLTADGWALFHDDGSVSRLPDRSLPQDD